MDEKIISILEQMQSSINNLSNKVDSIDNSISLLEKKVDNNHIEVINKLNVLEDNQSAIKRYIINSDVAFKKSEEAFNVITKFKEALTK